MNNIKASLLVSTMAAGLALSYGAMANTTPKQGGTLTVPLIASTFVDDFNPLTALQEHLIKGFMFEPLWASNVMDGTINWRLASGYAYADDLMSMTIQIKPNLTWSDGKPLTVDDVVYSLKLGQEDAKLDASGQWTSGVIKSVSALSDSEVLIEFNKKNATLDWYLANIYVVPKHIWQDVEDKVTFANTNPVGSGPMTEVKQVRDNQIEICRNPHYYKSDQGLPYLDCIKFRQYSDNSQIQPALINDEIDWGSNFIADIDKTYVEPNPENHGYWYPANDLINIYLNTRKAPFSDINFRKAFSMAMDRPMIVDFAAYGYPTVAKHVTGIGAYFKAYFNDQVNAKYDYLAQYDSDAVMQLLDDSGYKDIDGDGFLENPDGTPIDFDIHVVNGWTDWVQSVQIATELLAEVGIKAQTKTVDWSVYDAALKEGTYDASMNWSRTGVDPIVAYIDYFHSSRLNASWHTNHGISSPEIDAIIDEYQIITNDKRKQEILAQLMEYTAENMPFIPLFSNPTWFQYNTTRVGGWPNESDPYVQPTFFNPATKLILFERLYAK